MQTNELNKLMDVESDPFKELDIDKRNQIMETVLGKDDDASDHEKLKANQTPMPPEKVAKIREEIKQLLKKGKSHRFIRRHIKRKYNISEY